VRVYYGEESKIIICHPEQSLQETLRIVKKKFNLSGGEERYDIVVRDMTENGKICSSLSQEKTLYNAYQKFKNGDTKFHLWKKPSEVES